MITSPHTISGHVSMSEVNYGDPNTFAQKLAQEAGTFRDPSVTEFFERIYDESGFLKEEVRHVLSVKKR